MTTPVRTRFVKTPNPTKYTRTHTKVPATTPRRVHRNARNIEDETLPIGFTEIGSVDPAVSQYQTAQRLLYVDSDEARAGPSGISDSSDCSDPGELSIVAEFDELMAAYDEELDDEITFQIYLQEFVQKQAKVHALWQKSMEECTRLQKELDKANYDIGDLSNKLNHARKLLDKETKIRRVTEEERNLIEQQMILARDLLFSDQYKMKLPDDTKEKLAFLNNTTSRSSLGQHGYGAMTGRLNTISEVNSSEMNSTGSLLSDFSFSRSEDDLDSSNVRVGKVWKTHRSAPPAEEPTTKKRRSSSGKVVEVCSILLNSGFSNNLYIPTFYYLVCI